MYGVLHHLELEPEKMSHLACAIETELVPLIAATPGFCTHRLYAIGPGVSLSLAVFVREYDAASTRDQIDSWFEERLDRRAGRIPVAVVGKVHSRKSSRTSAILGQDTTDLLVRT